jgi:hypothetical protein
MTKLSIKTAIAIAGVIAITGCSGINYAVENYSGVDVQRFEANGQTWRIFDKPAEGRLMITPTLGKAAAVGAAQGATFGLSRGGASPVQSFEAAANLFIKSRDKTCQVTSGSLVVNPQYEFFYSCG